jgi:hypothetical protein
MHKLILRVSLAGVEIDCFVDQDADYVLSLRDDLRKAGFDTQLERW